MESKQLTKKDIKLQKKLERPVGYSLIKNIVIWSFVFLVIFSFFEIAYEIIEENSNFNRPYGAGNDMFNKLLSINPFTRFRSVFMWIIMIGIPSIVGLVLLSKLINDGNNNTNVN